MTPSLCGENPTQHPTSPCPVAAVSILAAALPGWWRPPLGACITVGQIQSLGWRRAATIVGATLLGGLFVFTRLAFLQR